MVIIRFQVRISGRVQSILTEVYVIFLSPSRKMDDSVLISPLPLPSKHFSIYRSSVFSDSRGYEVLIVTEA
jgi:hypothetical protein